MPCRRLNTTNSERGCPARVLRFLIRAIREFFEPTASDDHHAHAQRPLRARLAASSTGDCIPTASTADATAAGAGVIIGRRPRRSDNGPPINVIGTNPTTYENSNPLPAINEKPSTR